ncbi:hypothetical protein HQ560_09670, partial [bacterium]|nr:hypothetical protein [bacterium]
MKSTHRTKVMSWGMLLCCAALAAAGPVEDAVKAFEAKQYVEVDTILEKLLAQKEPPAAALDVSLRAALATGRYLTAQKRIGAILRTKQTPNLLLLGADVAEWAGVRSLAAARYLTLATRAKGDSPDLRRALAALVREASYVDEFKRYVELQGVDGAAWTYGHALLTNLIQAGETEKYCDVAGVLIGKAKSIDQVSALHHRVRDDAQNGRLGRSDREAYLLPLMAVLKGKPRDYADVEHLFGGASRIMPPQQQVDVIFAIQRVLGSPLSNGLVQRFAAMRSLPTDAAKVAAGKKFLALEGMYRDSKDGEDYARYVIMLVDSPQVFNANGKPLVSAADLEKKLDTLRRKPGVSPATASHCID